MKALAMSQAPQEIRDPIRSGCQALAKQSYAESERAFLEVKAREPRSRLANAGVEIARIRREEVEQRALAALEKDDGGAARAVSVLESSVGLEPESPYLIKARETLLARLTPSVSDRQAAELIGLAARLSGLAPSALAALSEGAKQLESGAYQRSERAFATALEHAPEAKVAARGLELTAARRSREVEVARSAQQAEADAIRKRIAEADAKVESKDWNGALAMYERIAREPGAPPLEAKIAAAEAGMIAEVLERADRASEHGQWEPAQRALTEALERLHADEAAKAKAKSGLDRIAGGSPGQGIQHVRGAGLTSAPFLASVERFAAMMAEAQLEAARKIADKDPNRASEILRELSPFEASLAGIRELRKKLKVDVFTQKLERAQLAAEADNRSEAVRVLEDAVDAGKAPPALKRGVLAGCAALKQEQWIEAEKAFSDALGASPESRIADYALDVARTFRRRAETRALDTIRRDKPGVSEAVAVLAASREIEPADPVRADAAKVLLDRLKRTKRLSNGGAAELIGLIARLEGDGEVGRGAEALRAGDHAAAAAAFSGVLAKDPRREIAKIGLSRSQASLTEGVAKGDVPIENEATALVLRSLLDRRPQDEDLQATLEKLVLRVKVAPSPEAAGKYLGLAAVAGGVKGPLRESVDSGAGALSRGDLEEAARSLSRAVEIDPSNAIARAGFEAAKEAKKSDLVKRIVAEAQVGHDDRVKAALAKKLDEGGTVLEVMLNEAARLASLGHDLEASKILDAANAGTEGSAKVGVRRANDLLAAGKHQEAEKAYAALSEASEVAEAGEKIAFTRHIQKLLEGVRALARLEDLDNSAKAAAEIFAIDPRDSDVKRALEQLYAHAEKSAKANDTDEMIRALSIAALVIGRTQELGAPLRALRGGQSAQASEMLRKIGAEFAQESEDEETAEREPVVTFTEHARRALGTSRTEVSAGKP